MGVQITIRDIPDAVKKELAARAALVGKSTHEFLRAELERLASRSPIEQLLAQVKKGNARSKRRLSAAEIMAHRDADRR